MVCLLKMSKKYIKLLSSHLIKREKLKENILKFVVEKDGDSENYNYMYTF